MEVFVAGGGVESFVLSINYLQLNALSTFLILYHLVKAFMTHARNKYLFSIADLIVSNILSFRFLYLNGCNLHQKYKTQSLAVFKNKLLSFIRPIKTSIFNVNEPEGLKYLTRLHLRFNNLNEHKFRYGFLDNLNPLCKCSLEVADKQHYFLGCLNFENVPRFLLIDISTIDSCFQNLPSHLKVELLLFGDSKLFAINNNLIFKTSVKYVMTTNRFSVPLF